MAVLIVSAIFVLVMIGLSIRANARFRQEKRRHLKVCAPDNDLADIMRTSAN